MRDWPNAVLSLTARAVAISPQVDVDTQPTHVCVKAKKNILQLLLPAEVLIDASTCKRSATTGHLLLTCPKLHPIVTSQAPRPKKKQTAALPQPASSGPSGLLAQPPSAPGANLKGAVDVRSIVKTAGKTAEPAPAIAPSLGPDFDDEDEVPPLM